MIMMAGFVVPVINESPKYLHTLIIYNHYTYQRIENGIDNKVAEKNRKIFDNVIFFYVILP